MMDQKLLAYLEGYLTEKRKALFKKVLEDRTRHFTVVLEDIFQPHNASAVVRTCDIFGIQDVHAIENKYNNKISRHVAKGSQKWLSYNRYRDDRDNTKSCLASLKEKGYQMWVTDLQLMATSAPSGNKIITQCLEIAQMLIEKNISYGDSALSPIRIFSQADNQEQIKIRIDDKINRIKNGSGFAGDNDIDDMIGYLILLKIAKANSN